MTEVWRKATIAPTSRKGQRSTQESLSPWEYHGASPFGAYLWVHGAVLIDRAGINNSD